MVCAKYEIENIEKFKYIYVIYIPHANGFW